MAKIKYLDIDGLTSYDELIKAHISNSNATKADIGHSHDVATTSNNGFMSTSDKLKLEGIDDDANNYAHPLYTATTGVPIANQTPGFGENFVVSQTISDDTGHITSINSRNITIPNTEASSDKSGLVSISSQTFAGIKTFTNEIKANAGITTGGNILSDTANADNIGNGAIPFNGAYIKTLNISPKIVNGSVTLGGSFSTTADGTETTNGYSELKVGNNIATGNEGNAQGLITIYNSSTGGVTLQCDHSTDMNYKVYLPSFGGTLAIDDTFVGSGDNAKSGLVPTPPTTAGITKFLREDGVWEEPPNAGDITRHTIDMDNPHNVTASQLGLEKVDNTSDLDKPISTATQTALDGKSNTDHTHNYAGSSSVGGAATSANKVNTNLIVKLNSGTTENTNMFTFNGSVAKTINITPASIGASATHSHPYLSTSGGTVTGTVHVKNGQIYINNNTALYTYNTGGSAFPLVYINANNQVLLGHATYSTNNYYYTAGNHYFNKGVLISSGNLGSQSAYTSGFAVYGKWKDGANHDIVGKSSDGLGCFLGWTGSASYASVCTIRGRTCKYTNSNGTTTLSDKNLKKDFESFSEAHDNFFDNLKPTTYKFILGSSGRPHFGFITQEVEEALDIAGLTTKDFGGVNIIKLTSRETETYIDENGNEIQKDIEESSTNYLLDKNINEEHDLIYTEFISLNTWQIQKLKKRVKEQEEMIKTQEERIARLETLVM